MEEVIDEITHVNVSISTVQYTFSFFDVSLWTVLADVPGPVLVLFFGNSVQQEAFRISNIFFLELVDHFVFAPEELKPLVFGVLFVMVFEEDDIAVTVAFGRYMRGGGRANGEFTVDGGASGKILGQV